MADWPPRALPSWRANQRSGSLASSASGRCTWPAAIGQPVVQGGAVAIPLAAGRQTDLIYVCRPAAIALTGARAQIAVLISKQPARPINELINSTNWQAGWLAVQTDNRLAHNTHLAPRPCSLMYPVWPTWVVVVVVVGNANVSSWLESERRSRWSRTCCYPPPEPGDSHLPAEEREQPAVQQVALEPACQAAAQRGCDFVAAVVPIVAN